MGRGAHFRNTLTDSKVRSVKSKDRSQQIADGAGLFLTVDARGKRGGGSKRWRLRLTVRDFSGQPGKLITMGLGNFKDVSLAQARERAQLFRTIAQDGRMIILDHIVLAPRDTETCAQIGAGLWLVRKRTSRPEQQHRRS